MKDLSVSIVIPAWNEAETILNCVKSAMKQSVMPKEVIVVNNKSTDDTKKIVKEYIALHSKEHPEDDGILKIIDQNEFQGLIPTRNLGLNTATGDILGRIDSDAIISPDWVKSVINGFQDDSVQGATGPVTYYDMPMRRFSFNQDNRIRKLLDAEKNEFPMMFGTNMAVRKSAWNQIKEEVCLDTEDLLHEDIDISIHMALNEFRVHYVEDMAAGMSARRIEDKLKDFRFYQERMLTTFTSHGIEPTKYAKLGRLTFLVIWFPLHALRPQYMKRFEKMKEEYLENLWEDGGKMTPLPSRAKLHAKSLPGKMKAANHKAGSKVKSAAKTAIYGSD
jgi:cellulose synthase/poly-beta-1,6-N-acetylglucosamine synthase-like glycosyltransferase